MENGKIYILNKAYYLKNGDIKYFESSCRLLDSIKNDFKKKNIDIYQDDYPNYDIIKEDLQNKENTLLIVDENDEVYAQITSTYDELNSIFNETEVAKILSFYNLPNIPYIGLSRLFVDNRIRSHGVATFLIKEMEEKYKGNTIIFFVHLVNNNALKLYEQLGYKNLGSYNFIFGEYYTFIKSV